MQDDRQGYTEREWEKIWTGTSQNDGAQTAHVSSLDDETYCEGCDSEVIYSADEPNGRCHCDSDAAPDLVEAWRQEQIDRLSPRPVVYDPWGADPSEFGLGLGEIDGSGA